MVVKINRRAKGRWETLLPNDVDATFDYVGYDTFSVPTIGFTRIGTQSSTPLFLRLLDFAPQALAQRGAEEQQMAIAKSKWLAYTVLVGLIPIFSRFLIWLVTKEGSIEPFAAQEFIAFGLVLLISNINEIEHLSGVDRPWKTAQNGTSAFLIAIHGVLFCLTLIGGDAIEPQAIMQCVAITALASLGFSYALFNRISKIRPPHPEPGP